MLLSLKDASLAYGLRALLDRAELQIDAGDHIALVGRNGTGKSSLLQVLAGTVALDKGELWIAEAARIALVPQEPVFDDGVTVFDAVASGIGATNRLLSDYHRTAETLSHASSALDVASLTERLSQLQTRIEREGAWVFEHRIESALSV